MPTNQQNSIWQRWVYRILAITFVLCVVGAVVSIWANVRIQNSDAWSQTVAPMAEDPDVQAFIVDRSMALIDQQIDEDSESGRLPRAFNLLQPLIKPALTEVIDSDVFAEWWVDANYYAHETLVTAAQGDHTDVVSVDATALVLNLQPLLDKVNNQIESKIPGVSYSIELSDERASVEILHSEAISTIVRSFEWIDQLSLILPIMAIGSLVAAMLVASDRVRGLRNLLISLALTSMLVIAGLFLFRFFFVAGQPDTDQAMYAALLRITLGNLMIALTIVAGISAAGGVCCAIMASRSKSLPLAPA